MFFVGLRRSPYEKSLVMSAWNMPCIALEYILFLYWPPYSTLIVGHLGFAVEGLGSAPSPWEGELSLGGWKAIGA